MLNLTEIFRRIGIGVMGLTLFWACNQVIENPDRHKTITNNRPIPQSGDASGDPADTPAPGTPAGDAILALHTPAPAACISCHEDKRPNKDHYAGKDCVTCHKFPSFKGGFFAHAPKPTVCEECHARPATVGARAYPNIGTPANFNANDPAYPGSGHYRGKDCVACHATPAENAPRFAFAHAKQSPQACLPCHFPDGVGEHQGDNRGVELTGFGNCFNCHKNFDQTVQRNWDRQ